MKKFLIVFMVVSLIMLLVACDNNIKTENENNQEAEVSLINKEKNDDQLLAYFNENVQVVENREDYFDASGELLYYVQKDYLKTHSDDEALKKIVSNYPVVDLYDPNDEYEGELTRMYPDDIYYDTTTYSIGTVHNGIITIFEETDYWMGSPHPYPGSSSRNYVLSTGEEYRLPAEYAEEIYDEVTKAWMEKAKSLNYEDLLGNYYMEDGSSIQYLEFDDKTQTSILINEDALYEIVKNMVKEGSFEFIDDKLLFHINAEYNLSDWAGRNLYSFIEIDNKWGI